jgi:hypothetical protein
MDKGEDNDFIRASVNQLAVAFTPLIASFEDCTYGKRF